MNYNEYQTLAATTAIYKNPIIYPSLGILNELEELMSKMIDFFSDSKPGFLDELLYELGDVFWYVANLSREVGIDLSDLFNDKNPSYLCLLKTVKDLKDGSNNEDILMGISAILWMPVGKIQGIAKKILRDGPDYLTEEKKEVIVSSLSGLCDLLMVICNVFGLNIEKAMEMNIDKLSSRKERGVITGDGDHR